MKIRIVSAVGESVGLAIRLRAEGHEVSFWCNAPGEKDCGDGFIEKVDDWRADLPVDLLIFDDLDQRHKGEPSYTSSKWSAEMREQYPDMLIIGGGDESVGRLENDRMFAQEIMQAADIPTVPMYQFTSFEQARKFAEENEGGWALKHQNQIDRDCAGVFDDSASLIEFLNYLEKNWATLAGESPNFVLQEKAEGIEIAVTCFFDGQKFRSEACYVNQEYKKMLDGDIGRCTGQMGEIGIIVPDPGLYQETLAKIEPFLQGKNYVGFADLNCIVNGDKIVPLEFTIGRPGYPTLFSFLECLAEPVGEWLARMTRQDPAPIRVRQPVNCTLVLATGTFPDQDPKRNKLAVVKGLDKVGLQHVWLCEARWDDQEQQVMGAGEMGYLAVITNAGNTIQEACQGAYQIIEQIKVQPYAIWRQDIGARAIRELPIAAQEGWL